MTIFKSAYDTLACGDAVMTRTEQALQAVYHTGHLGGVGKSRARQLQGGAAVADAVPAFAHPVVIHDKDGGEDKPICIIDVRAFGKYDLHQAKYMVRSSSEYAFAQLRARINQMWVSELPKLLFNVSPLAMKMYASWIAENVARRFDLNPKEQVQLQILAAYFYYSLHEEQHPITQAEKHRHTAAVIKGTGITASLVDEVVSRFDHPIASITEFCQMAAEVCDTVRLKDLTPGLLIAQLSGTWFGAGGNAKEMLAVALEHPPTWLAILATAAQDRSYKNSYITKLLERQDRRDKGMTLVRSLSVALDAVE